MKIDEPIRALWWKQPFASLMLEGKIETRTWSTNYRGLVLICASKTPYSTIGVANISGQQLYPIAEIAKKTDLFTYPGNAIAIGRLIDCRPMTIEDEAKCFVKYRAPWLIEKQKKDGTTKLVEKKLWCHIYEDVQPIEPFGLKGCQGWLKLNQDIISKIKLLTPTAL